MYWHEELLLHLPIQIGTQWIEKKQHFFRLDFGLGMKRVQYTIF